MRQRSDDHYGQLLMVPEIRFAHAAVSRLLTPTPPVVTLYGAAGMGKTLIARALVREFQQRPAQNRICRTTAAEFSTQLASASKSRSIPEFQQSHRSLNLLVCEDLQAIEGRSQTQQQLLAILDEIQGGGGAVLLTCNRSPGDLADFSPKLRSRCQGGICAAIEPYSADTRKKLLLHFAVERGFTIADDIAEFLADALTISARELRGAVLQLEHLSGRLRKTVDREMAKAIVDNAVIGEKPRMNDITNAIAKEFCLTARQLKSADRHQGLVLPRQLAMFAAREWAQRAYSEIGKHFGRRSHSTIVYACQKVREKIDSDSAFRQLVERLHEQLCGSRRIASRSSTTS